MDAEADQGRIAFPPIDWQSMPGRAFPFYVASVTHRREEKAAKRLEAMGFGVFLPKATVTSIRRRYRWGRWFEETKKRPVVAFPSYLFIAFDIATPDWRRITQDQDVRLIFGPHPERPAPVSWPEMLTLFRQAQDRPMGEQQQQALIEAGIAVVVKDGLFAGQHSVCEWTDGKSVRLNLSLFGRPTPTTLDIDQVENAEVQD